MFKRLPVQTTYLFLQAFLKYFYSQEMLTTSEIQITLNIDIISRITNDYDILWRKLWSKWVELVSVQRCTCLFTHTLKMITRRNTSLILFRRKNYLQFFAFWIFFNPNYANLYGTIHSFILECLQYQNYGLRWNKPNLFQRKVLFTILLSKPVKLWTLNFTPMKWFVDRIWWLSLHSFWSFGLI